MNTQKNAHQCDPAGKEQIMKTEGIVFEAEEHCKRLATLSAKAALAGHTLTKTNGGYMLSRWQYSRHCVDLDTIEALLTRMGGAS